MNQQRILGINGSPRKGGNSAALLGAIMEGAASSGALTHSLALRDYTYSSCTGCEKCRKDKTCTGHHDGMTLLYPLILESRGLVLVTPVHHYNVTAWVKAFIDRLYCFYDFTQDRPRGWASRLAGQGRKALIAAIGEQPDIRDFGATLEMMRLPLQALGYEVLGELPVLGVFDRGRVKDQPALMRQAVELGVKLGGLLSP